MGLPDQVELLKLFQAFLQQAGLSSVSIKNYLSDLRHFLSFCTTHRARPYRDSNPSRPGPDDVSPSSVTTNSSLRGGTPTWQSHSITTKDIFQNLNTYLDPYLQAQKASFTPANTTNRRLASIRRFSTFLNSSLRGGTPTWQSPSISPTHRARPYRDSNPSRPGPDDVSPSPFLSSAKILEQFKTYLEKDKKSPSTVKNYLSDLHHFFLWTANQTPFTDQNLVNILSEQLLSTYVTYLKLSHTSTSVINRRQSSIKKLTKFSYEQGYLPENPFELKNIPQTLPPLAWLERLTHRKTPPSGGARNRIGQAYDRYHALPWTPYLNLALLVLATTAMAIFAYNQIVSQARPSSAATALTPPKRQLSFQGRLTDSGGTPITTAVNVVFKLFNALSGPTQLYTTGTCSITPDQDGIFNTLLGDTVCGAEITSTVFTDNRDVYLEITVGAETLTPRQQIATVGYALNSETLQGYPASSAATINTVPVVDNSGNINIAAPSPSLISSSGTFSVQGQVLALKTGTNSGGDVIFQPDALGSGQILALGGTTTDDSFRVTNANLTSGSLLSGYVGNDTATGRLLSLTSGSTETDRFWVAADGRAYLNTNATNSAFIVNQSGTGNLFSASASGVAKFTLNNAGIISLLDGVAHTIDDVGGNLTLTSNSTTISLNDNVTFAGTTTLNSLAYTWPGSQTINYVLQTDGSGTLSWVAQSAGGSSNWRITAGALSPINDTLDLLVGSTASASAKFAVLNVNSGTPTASVSAGVAGAAFLTADGNLATTAKQSLTLGNSTTGNIILNAGNVGIGTTAPLQALHVVGQCVTGDTLLRRKRRRRGKNGEWIEEWEDVRIDEIQEGDEIQTLDEKTGKFVTQKIKGLMDMGIQETYLLITESGKQIRTTAQHPYLTMSAKPTALIIGGTYQIDQSPRLETLTQDSYIALANKHIQFVAKISKRDKLLLKAVYNKNNKSKYYGTDVFAKSVAMLLRAAGIHDAKIQIDRDYSGHENRINEIIRREVGEIQIEYISVGHNIDSYAHLAAYRAFKGESKPTLTIHKKDRDTLKGVGQGTVTLIPSNQTGSTRDLSVNGEYHKTLDLSKNAVWKKISELKIGMQIATLNGWETIIVLKKFSREQVYDIEVENTHNFVANGIVAHNTYISGSVGIGTTGPDAKLDSLATTEQLRLTYTDGTVYSAHTVDSSGNLTIDNTGTKTIIADDLQITGGDILDSNGNESIRFGTTASAVNEATLTNAATGGIVTLAATGGDTDIALSIDSKGADALNLNSTATGDVNLAGGYGGTGCTVTNSNGNLSCNGTITGTFAGTLPWSSIIAPTANLSLAHAGYTTAFTFDSLTSASAFALSSTSTAGGASGVSKLLDINRSGTNTNASHTAYGLYSAVTNTGTTSTNVGGYFSASGATNNYGLIVANGNVGIGTTGPAATSILDLTSTTKGFLAPRMTTTQRDAISTPATGLFVYNTTDNQYNVFNGTTWGAVGGGGGAWSDLTVPTGNLTLAMDADTTTFNWDTLTTGTGWTGASTSLSSGTLESLSVNSTAATGNTQKVLSLSTAGANATSTQTTYGLYATNTHTGTASTNIGGYFSASGGTNNYGLIVGAGSVGIGTAAPGYTLDVAGIAAANYFVDNDNSAYGLDPAGTANFGGYSQKITGGALLAIDSGNVGIGNDTPLAKLDVTGTASVSGILSLASSIGTQAMASLTIGNSTTGNIVLNGGALTSNVADAATAVAFTLNSTNTLSTQGSKLLSLQNNGTEKMYLDASGNLYVAGTVLSGNGISMLLTNKSGGIVASKAIVVLDTSNNTSFTTTTTPYSKAGFGVVVGVGLGVTNDADGDGVCDANDICMVAYAGSVNVTVKNATTAAKGEYLFTSDTAGSAVASAKQYDGLVGIVDDTTNAASGYLKMIFKVQPQVTAAAAIDKGTKHNEYWLYADQYKETGEGSDTDTNLLARGLMFDTLSDSTKTDSANTTASLNTAVQKTGLLGGQTLATSTTDNDGQTYLGSNTVNKTFYYDRTVGATLAVAHDSSPAVQVELGLDPNWYNGVTLSVATTSAQFSQSSTVPSGVEGKNPNLSTSYNGSLIKATGTDSTPRTIYITIKSPTTFDWTNYNGQATTGVTITPGTAQALGTTGVSAKFTDARYNTGDVFKIASWFIEAESSTRGAKQQFPERSTVIATASSVDIIDADTQKLWMRFSQGTSYAIGVDANNDPSSANMLNGKAYISTNGSSATGLYTLDFAHDAVFKQNATDYRLSDTAIYGRNGTNTFNVINTSNILVNITANDVSAAVICTGNAAQPSADTLSGRCLTPQQFVGVATGGGITLINETNQTAVNASDTSAFTNIAMTYNSGSATYNSSLYGAKASSTINVYTNLSALAASFATTTTYSTTVNPAPAATAVAINSLQVTAGTSTVDTKSNTIYVGTAAGAGVIQENQATFASGSVKYYTSTTGGAGAGYISEEMVGNVQGMWGFNSALTDSSVKAATITAAGATITYPTGVRGKSINITVANGTATTTTIAANYSMGIWVKETTGWTHYVKTDAGTYINGVLSSTAFTSRMTWATTTVTLVAGTQDVDEMFATNTTMTAGQIKHMYQVGYRALQSHATTLGGGAADTNQQLGMISTGTNTVGDARVDYNNQFMYVGTNSTTLGAVSKIDLNSDTNIKTYNSSANVPTGGALLIDEDTKSLAVGYNLEAVGSATGGVKTMGVDNNATATSGNFIGKTVTTAESFTQAYLWAQYTLDSSDASNTITVSASNDGGSNYSQCNLTNTDTSQSPTEYEYFCQFNTAGSSLKTKFAFARGSTKTNTYVTRYGIAWIGSDAIAGAPGGNGLYTTTNASVANGSYIDVAHNQNNNDVVTNGWIYDGAKWIEIDDHARTDHNTQDPKLLSWYKMEEANGDLDNAQGTAARDLIDLNGPTYQTAGRVNKAVTLDGTNDYFCTGSGTTCADADTLDFAAADSFTLGGWFKHAIIATNPDYMVVKVASGIGYKLYMENDGDFTFAIDDDASFDPDDSATSTVATYDDNAWHHVAAVKNGTTNIKLYVDGEEVASDTSISATGTLANTGPFYLGVDSDGSSNPWAGSLDETFAYSRALTPGEIGELYRSSKRFAIEQTDANTVRLYNYSGSAQNLRLDVITGGLGRNAGTVSLAPAAADVDSQANVNSLWINKTGTGGNLLKLQTSGTDVLSLATAGTMTLTGNFLPGTDNTYALGSTSARWKDLFLGPASLHISSTTGTSGVGANYVDGTLGYSSNALTLATAVTGTVAGGGSINLTSGLALGNTTTSAFNLTTTADFGATDEVLQIGDSAGTFMTVLGNGNVGIGTTSPSTKLDVSGSAIVSGDTATTVNTGSASNTSPYSTTSTTFTNVTTFTISVSGNRLVKGLSWVGQIKGSNSVTATYQLFADSACTRPIGSSVTTESTTYVLNQIDIGNTQLLQLGSSGNIVVYGCLKSGSTLNAYVDEQYLNVKYEVPGDYWRFGSASNTSPYSTTSTTFTNVTTFTISVSGNRLVKGLSWVGQIKCYSTGTGCPTYQLFADSACTRPMASSVTTASTTYVLNQIDIGNTQLLQLGSSGNIVVYGCMKATINTVYVDEQYLNILYTAGLVDVLDASPQFEFNQANTNDVAEYITGEADLGSGMIAAADPILSEYVVKANLAYQKSLIGIVSTNPFLINNQSSGNIALALAGRVPTYVSTINGPINNGDPITSSEISGFGMKATKAGSIVGKALEGFNPENGRGEIIDCPEGTPTNVVCGKIMVFVNVSWYDPDVYLTDSSDLLISSVAQTYNLIKIGTQEIINRIGAFSEVVAANIRAGAIETKDFTTETFMAFQGTIDNLLINNGLVSPVIQTNLISSLADETDVTVRLGTRDEALGTSQEGKLTIQNAQGEEVSSLDSQGNATFSGTLGTESTLYVKGDSSLAGTVTVGGGSGKMDVGTVDPPYTINGEKYATYLSSTIGIKEEVMGKITVSEAVDGLGYRVLIDLDAQPKGSDLWLFSKTTDIKANIDRLSVLLTAAGQAKTWYELDEPNKILAIYSSTPADVTYRLTAPRFDSAQWTNTRTSKTIGFVLNDPDNSTNTAGTGLLSSFVIAPELIAKVDGTYQVKINGQETKEVSSFFQSLIANLKVGTQVVTNLVATNLTIRTKLISPIADIDQLKVIDATVSGTLYADNIKGKTVDRLTVQLDLLSEKYSTASAILADLQAKYASYDSLALTDLSAGADPLALSPLATTSANLPSDLVLDSLLVNGSLFAQSFSSFDSDLYIQPTGDKPVHLLANLMTLYPDGKIVVNGDLLITGTIYSMGLDTRTATVSGTLAAGGLIIASDNPIQTATVSAQTSSNATIGTATIASDSAEVVIANQKVTGQTLIYLTPISDTGNQVLYVKSKQAGVGFTVAVPAPLTNEVSFNYWLVETK